MSNSSQEWDLARSFTPAQIYLRETYSATSSFTLAAITIKGIEAGWDLDAKFVYATKPGRYTAENVQKGKGFGFSAEIGPLSYTRSGDFDEGEPMSFKSDGTTNTSHGGLIGSGLGLMPGKLLSPGNYNEVLRMLTSSIKVKVGGSYQWSQGYVLFGL